MIIKSVSAGPIDANCYIICDESTKCGAIIDPGAFDQRILQAIKDAGIENLQYILCTHGHFDHIAGVAEFKNKFPSARIGIGTDDASMLWDCDLNLANGFGVDFTPANADVTFNDGDLFEIGDLTVKVHFAPGHTPGGVVYDLKEGDLIFTGDTLFCGSIGRTDLPGGNFWTLLKTLKGFSKFDDKCIILPGHGEKSTLEYEYNTNPYFKR